MVKEVRYIPIAHDENNEKQANAELWALQLNNSGKNNSADGRITVVLVFILGLLVFDLSPRFTTSFWGRSARCERLQFAYPDKLVVESCRTTGSGRAQTTAPARYSPFFYAAMPINSASKEMLMTVKGIGPVLAEDITTYRQHVGLFTSSTDLHKLPGIGPKRAAKLATAFTYTEVP